MYKLKPLLLPVAWLLAFMALACAPPDDDDRSSGPSGPAITSASYDVGTALLTVQGTDLSPTEAQIQTIKVDGVALDSYTADDDATGVNSNGLEQGKYRIKSDGTKLWLRLTDQHKAVLEAKVGSNGLKKGLLSVGSGAWAGLNTPKDLDVSNVPENKQSKVSDDNQPSKQTEDEQAEQAEEDEQVEEAEEESPKQPKAEEQSPELPEAEQTEEVEDKQSKTETEEQSPKQAEDKQLSKQTEAEEAAITRATYHVGTALLTVQGTHLGSATQAQIQTIKVYDLVFSSYTATATGPDSRGLAKGKYRIKNDGTALWLRLTDDDKATLNGKPGMDSNGLKDGLLSVGTGAWAGLNTAKALAVSGNPPAITRATYNVATGVLVITGTNLPKAVTGWDFTKLRFVAGNGAKSTPLLRHQTTSYTDAATGSAASATSLTITLKGNEKRKVDIILVRNGESDDAGAYNLEAAAGFAGGRAADTSNNPITVSGYVSSISDVYYNVNTGVLIIRGSGLPKTVAEWDFSKLTIVSVDDKKYTLPRHSNAGENTATGSRADTIGVNITLSGSVKAKVNAILVKVGKSGDGFYNLEAAAGFVTGSPADLKNAINVVDW